MICKNAMIRDPLVVGPDTKISEFVEMVSTKHQTTGVVVDKDRKLLGVVSVHDLYLRMLPHFAHLDERLAQLIHESAFEEELRKFADEPIKKIMNTNGLTTVEPDNSIMRALEIFVHRGFNTLPVVDGGKFLGSVSRRSVLENINSTK